MPRTFEYQADETFNRNVEEILGPKTKEFLAANYYPEGMTTWAKLQSLMGFVMIIAAGPGENPGPLQFSKVADWVKFLEELQTETPDVVMAAVHRRTDGSIVPKEVMAFLKGQLDMPEAFTLSDSIRPKGGVYTCPIQHCTTHMLAELSTIEFKITIHGRLRANHVIPDSDSESGDSALELSDAEF